MFDRTIKLIGIDNFNKIKEKTVAVIGLGGVGGYAVESLIRGGIHNIILVDFDNIDITNLNRQIIATKNNINKLKTEEFKKRILEINDKVNITIINEFLNKDNIQILSKYKIDYIIDACDTITTKELLIDYSIKNNIKIISSMGMGNKQHPELLEITDIRKTSYDPIAKKLRKYINDNKIKEKIYVVYSKEKPLTKDKIIASNSYVPACAGLLCTSYVINDILT